MKKGMLGLWWATWLSCMVVGAYGGGEMPDHEEGSTQGEQALAAPGEEAQPAQQSEPPPSASPEPSEVQEESKQESGAEPDQQGHVEGQQDQVESAAEEGEGLQEPSGAGSGIDDTQPDAEGIQQVGDTHVADKSVDSAETLQPAPGESLQPAQLEDESALTLFASPVAQEVVQGAVDDQVATAGEEAQEQHDFLGQEVVSIGEVAGDVSAYESTDFGAWGDVSAPVLPPPAMAEGAIKVEEGSRNQVASVWGKNKKWYKASEQEIGNIRKLVDEVFAARENWRRDYFDLDKALDALFQLASKKIGKARARKASASSNDVAMSLEKSHNGQPIDNIQQLEKDLKDLDEKEDAARDKLARMSERVTVLTSYVPQAQKIKEEIPFVVSEDAAEALYKRVIQVLQEIRALHLELTGVETQTYQGLVREAMARAEFLTNTANKLEEKEVASVEDASLRPQPEGVMPSEQELPSPQPVPEPVDLTALIKVREDDVDVVKRTWRDALFDTVRGAAKDIKNWFRRHFFRDQRQVF